MPKEINSELKELIESQCEIEGFDYAMVEKLSLNNWDKGVVPLDILKAYQSYMATRNTLIRTIKSYGVDCFAHEIED